MPGMKMMDAELLSRSTAEAILARIGNLDEIYNWKVEEFSLDKKDLEGVVLSASELNNIDASFRSSLKFVVNTLGDDIQEVEASKIKKNIFPSFPDRPIDDGWLKTHKVKQFIKIEKVE